MHPCSTWAGLQVARPTDVSYLDEYGVTSVGLQVYTRGECWYLAWVLHQLTGFDLVAVATVASDIDDLFWGHVLIRLPDGRYLDVLGIQTGEQVIASWTRKRRRKMRLVSLGRLSSKDYSMLLEHDLESVPAAFAHMSTEVAHYLLAQVDADLKSRSQRRASSVLV